MFQVFNVSVDGAATCRFFCYSHNLSVITFRSINPYQHHPVTSLTS